MTADVSVIIVTFNSGEHIADCLHSLREAGEVVVVDNASSDDTCEIVAREAPEAKLIRNARNRGFAAAVNQGVAASSSSFVLLLNPDTVLQSSLHPLVEYCLLPQVGAAGGRLVDEDGEAQEGFNIRAFPTPAALLFEVLLINRLWPSNPVNRRYRCLGRDPEVAGEVDQPAGAFLMVRRDVLRQIGGLDETFHPIWFEDVDLCLRIHKAGHVIHYIPSCVARHKGGHSLPRMSVEERYRAWYGNLLRFNYKHFSKGTGRCLHTAVQAGLRLRWLLCLLGAGSSNERKAYENVIKTLGGFSVRDRNVAAGLRTASPAESKSS
jgi:hypothetical protein